MADLYLGKAVDTQSGALGDRFLLEPSDLTTHGIVIGMTGSGKTGLCVVLIEEALNAGVPVIAIDPKGDITNLALTFPGLSAAEFRPWVDEAAAAREGKAADQAATEAAESWKAGLADWGISPEAVAGTAAARDVRILTPGSNDGIPLNVVGSLAPPSDPDGLDDDDLRETVETAVGALLGLLKVEADPLASPEYILLHELIAAAWRRGEAQSLERLIGEVASPPIEKIGALPLETVFPQAKRQQLALQMNNLLASPAFQPWREGDALDIEAWQRTADGRPRLTIIHTAHLDDERRMFVTAMVLSRIRAWMRRQPGTSELRCLVYMDEIFGYFPPTANPPTKPPMLSLLKQARAHGVGVLLATQNPVDLDYRGLANMGFWAIGRLQTSQDQARVRSGIEAAIADAAMGVEWDDLIGGVKKRVFLVHDVHRKKPELVHSRWAMAYLRGPMTGEEIERLSQGQRQPAAPPAAVARSAAAAPVAAAPPQAATTGDFAPPLPAPLRHHYLKRYGGTRAEAHVFLKAGVRYRVGRGSTEERVHSLAFPLAGAPGPAGILDTPGIDVDEGELETAAPGGIAYGDLPGFVQEGGAKGLERALKDRLDDYFETEILYDPETKMISEPGESANEFAVRVQSSTKVREEREKLRQRLETKHSQIAAKREEAKGRKFEKWAAVGTALFSNLRIATGRKRTVTGVGGVLSKHRMESTAKGRIEQLDAEAAALAAELEALETVNPSRFETQLVKPSARGVTLLRVEIAWVY